VHGEADSRYSPISKHRSSLLASSIDSNQYASKHSAQLSIDGIDDRIVGRVATAAEVQSHVVRVCPEFYLSSGKLGYIAVAALEIVAAPAPSCGILTAMATTRQRMIEF
jgi:hypothetical protein